MQGAYWLVEDERCRAASRDIGGSIWRCIEVEVAKKK